MSDAARIALQPPARRYGAFGLTVATELVLPGGWRYAGVGREVAILPASASDITDAFSGRPKELWEGWVDETSFFVWEGEAGDVLMQQVGVASLLLSADHRALAFACTVGEDVRTLRTLLDTALHRTALHTGLVALHGAGVATENGVIAVLGESGAGKSSLASALRAEGLAFFSDDILVLHEVDGKIVCDPGPPVSTIPEHMHDDSRPLVAAIDDERWVAEVGASGPLPISAVVVLAEGGEPASPMMTVLCHALAYPQDAAPTRFRVIGDALRDVPVMMVPARSAPPVHLAATIVANLRARGVST